MKTGGAPVAMPPVALLRWWIEGLRTALLMRPNWPRLAATPLLLALLMLASAAIEIVGERLFIVDANAAFAPQALLNGWFGVVLVLWLAWIVARRAGGLPPHPRAAQVFGVVIAQQTVIGLIAYAAFVPLVRSGAFASAWPPWLVGASWYAPVVWMAVAEAVLLLRQLPKRSLLRAAVPLVAIAGLALEASLPRPPLWTAASTAAGADAAPFVLSDQVIEKQRHLLDAAVGGLAPERPGVIDLYSLTFAPYGSQDVFLRESELVNAVMQRRFDAAGRSLQLVNNPRTAERLPWATAANLHRAIDAAAAKMNRGEDVLFIHITSHGGANAQLASELAPLALDPLTPSMLRGWLDSAGVRWRVISISACYAGSWISTLRGPGTLVMTAADAEHTSYGCGSRSELTFFGRAMFDEGLQRSHDFEQAFAAARPVIEQREREAGKTDGYSNPQIDVGAGIREPLARLRDRLDAAPTASSP